MTPPARPIEILFVEDDLVDIEFTLELLADSKLVNRVHTAHNGMEALEYLRESTADPGVPRPDVILLDLNMPRMDGHELLRIIKNDGDLKTIPVVIMTTSKEEADVLRSYQLHANAYVAKPIGLDQFGQIVQSIESFWFQIVALPGRS